MFLRFEFSHFSSFQEQSLGGVFFKKVFVKISPKSLKNTHEEVRF